MHIEPASAYFVRCAIKLIYNTFGDMLILDETETAQGLSVKIGYWTDIDPKVSRYLPPASARTFGQRAMQSFQQLVDLSRQETSAKQLDECVKLIWEISAACTEAVSARRVAEEKVAASRRLLRKRLDPIEERRAALKRLWASGKFSSRDVCAEQEWEELGFPSFRAARESLNGTPDPRDSVTVPPMSQRRGDGFVTSSVVKYRKARPYVHLNYRCTYMALLRKNTAAKVLDLSKSGLEKLVAGDPSFPRPIKMGETRQAAVFFDEGEIHAWIDTKKAQRLELAA